MLKNSKITEGRTLYYTKALSGHELSPPYIFKPTEHTTNYLGETARSARNLLYQKNVKLHVVVSPQTKYQFSVKRTRI